MAKKRIVYFTKKTQEGIILYNQSTNPEERSYLYEMYIHKPMRKIIENVIHRYKFHYSDADTMPQYIHDIECRILEKISLYNPEMGRAYSYFSKAVYITLINYNRENYNRILQKGTYDEVDNSDVCYKRHDSNTYMKEELRADYFTEDFVEFVENNIHKHFETKVELATASAILSIISSRYEIDILDRKSIYLYVKNIVNVSNVKFMNVFNVIKTMYNTYRGRYVNEDGFDISEVDYELEEVNEIDDIFNELEV